MIRSTTNGTLKTYRYSLQRSSYTMNKARETVQTQRQFNSFAEDPAAAAKAFQLRRSLQRTDSQYNVGDSVKHKYEVPHEKISDYAAGRLLYAGGFFHACIGIGVSL